jgi:DNA topoisomerase VI subunit B
VTAAATLDREPFVTSRLMEYFDERELTMQIGHERADWPLALVKEAIDNALDGAEALGAAPVITVILEPDSVAVQDNGPGLQRHILEGSLDYRVRVSDKAHYVSPTRGHLGNGLKVLWAAPFVADSERGRVEIITGGDHHTIDITIDRLRQEPRLAHTISPDGDVKNGTLVRMHWPGIACSQNGGDGPGFYNELRNLLARYASLNPHAKFELIHGEEHSRWLSTAVVAGPEWRKWRPTDPTSPHWYSEARFCDLVSAYLSREAAGGPTRSVREFVATFDGLTGTAKQKAVTDSCGLTGARLNVLARDGDLDRSACADLLAAMQDRARAPRPAALGVLGESHIAVALERDYAIDTASIRYRKKEGVADSLPYVLEVALGIRRAGCEELGGGHIVGLNFSPCLRSPVQELPELLGEARVDRDDPVGIFFHLTCPHLEYVDRGKTRLALPWAIRADLRDCTEAVTKEWKRRKRQADQADRVRERDLEELRKHERQSRLSTKEAAYQVMPAAYAHASGDGRLPANARQIMYAAREPVQNLTGKVRPWAHSGYFTQHLLPDFVDEHPELAAGWDVVFDARGHLAEPHTDCRIDLGTIAVRNYIAGWHSWVEDGSSIQIAHAVPTAGPANRYRFAVFVEKEGFGPLLEAAGIAERFDVALMSTKGMSVTAARQPIDRLSEAGVTTLVVHDLDKAGFSILHTLRTDTRRYRFKAPPKVVDLGLRLEDVQAMGLQSEAVEYDGYVDPRSNLRECGATEGECEFLVRGHGSSGRWVGKRVELNAMTSPQLVAWLEQKLQAAGVRKAVPDRATLEAAYRRAWRRARVQKAIDGAFAAARRVEVAVPTDLEEQIAAAIAGTDSSWDDALWRLVVQEERERAAAAPAGA